MSDSRWGDVEHWITEHVIPHDEALDGAVERSDASGLPPI